MNVTHFQLSLNSSPDNRIFPCIKDPFCPNFCFKIGGRLYMGGTSGNDDEIELTDISDESDAFHHDRSNSLHKTLFQNFCPKIGGGLLLTEKYRTPHCLTKASSGLERPVLSLQFLC